MVLILIKGALYEYTESESLEKWVNEQAELVQEESEKYLRLQKQNIEETIYIIFTYLFIHCFLVTNRIKVNRKTRANKRLAIRIAEKRTGYFG